MRGYLPVKTEVFIRRIPFYYYRADRGYSFRSWIADLIRDTEEYEEELEKIYQVLEYLYYEGGVSIDEIMSYIKIQLYGKKRKVRSSMILKPLFQKVYCTLLHGLQKKNFCMIGQSISRYVKNRLERLFPGKVHYKI